MVPNVWIVQIELIANVHRDGLDQCVTIISMNVPLINRVLTMENVLIRQAHINVSVNHRGVAESVN